MSGFTNDSDADGVGLAITAVPGLLFTPPFAMAPGNAISGTKTFNLVVAYTNGAIAFASGEQTITITGLTDMPSGYSYSEGNKTTTVTIIDGQAATRAIPVTQANVNYFIAYATNITNGRTKHYIQTADITLTPPVFPNTSNWGAIGDNTTPFTGSYDGGNYTITGLTIDTTDSYQGMFGYIGTGGMVKNVGLASVSITGDNFTGGVVGQNNGGTVQKCYATGTVTGGNYTGGVVGYNFGTVVYCSFTGTVTGGSRTGGVAGINGDTVQNCYASGTVTGGSNTGGVVGENSNGTLQNCYATATVTSTSGTNVGGVVGVISWGTVQNCYASGTVTGTDWQVGGVTGNSGNDMVPMQNCVAFAPTVTGIGGNVGRVMGSGYGTNNYARSDMTAGGVAFIGTNAHDDKGGADITAAEWNSASWWEHTALFPASAWDFRAGLPTLKNMPGPAQNPQVITP